MSPQQQTAQEISLEDASAGMILASPVKDPKKDESLLPEGTKLTQERIEALKRRDIYVLDVTEESYEEVTTSTETSGIDFNEEELERLAEDVLEEHEEEEQQREEERRDFYQETIEFTRVLFDDIQRDRGIEVGKIREKIEEMIQLLSQQREEILKMTRIRNDNNYILSHTVNVTLLSLHIGRELEFSRTELTELGIGCMLHDIGMTDIPEKLLEKKGPLTDKEYEIIQSHPLFREELLQDTSDLSYFARSVV
ncbi:MAG: HD-GYP domain-containing protein, partial [bacterium]